MFKPRCVCTLIASAFTVAAQAQQVFVADIFNPDFESGAIRRVDFGNPDPILIVDTGPGVRGLDADLENGRLYWTDVDDFAIRRARIDGSQQEDVITTGLQFPSVVRLRQATETMYWGDQSAEEISTAPIDGPVGVPVLPTPFYRGLAIDQPAGRMFWTTSISPTSGAIRRANLDGSDAVTIVPALANAKPTALAIDTNFSRVYWTDHIRNEVRRCDFDGGNNELVFGGGVFQTPGGIGIDNVNARVYVGLRVDFTEPAFGRLMSFDVDGFNQEILSDALGQVTDIVIVNDAACPADFNQDGFVTGQDFDDYVAAFEAGDPAADFDRDGFITGLDFDAFVLAFEAGC